jgi:hypothetical protein
VIKKIKKILPLVVALIFIAAIFILTQHSQYCKNEIINMGLFIATVVLAVIAYIQLEALREQANADFLLRFNRDFFDNDTNQKIIELIEENRNIIKDNKGVFTYYQLDDYLGYYELMAHYEKKDFIKFDLIDEMFGHYISLAWRNEEIHNYITKLRKDTNDPRYYRPFEDLAIRIIKKEGEVRE